MPKRGGIVIVGPCAAGKSTLARGLEAAGWQARQIAQEHSYVPNMWQQISQPDVLIYLDASYETCSRRKSLNWSREEYQAQVERLEHARRHADIYIDGDLLSAQDVLKNCLNELAGRQ
jgi:deoxyadenosine/deoxycytidine kinase